MNTQSFVDGVVVFVIAITIELFDAIGLLLTFFQRGIFISKRDQLMNKTVKELKLLLIGVKGISKLKKVEMVNLLLGM